MLQVQSSDQADGVYETVDEEKPQRFPRFVDELAKEASKEKGMEKSKFFQVS